MHEEEKLNEDARAFRKLYERLDKRTAAFERLARFRKRIEKDLEYFVRDLQKTKTPPLDKQLKVIRKKQENYRMLQERVTEDADELNVNRKAKSSSSSSSSS